jgi:Uma2 family endonuclease
MAVAARRDARMRVAEYQVWVESRPNEERWELLVGEPVPMSPPPHRHQRLVYNLLRRVGDLADARGCEALPGLAILSEAMDDFAPFPDVVVRCGAELPDGDARDPVLIAEVLSPSTLANDRGRKVDFHLTVPSLRTFPIVYQNEARVEVRQRDRDGEMQVFGPDDRIALPELGGALAVSDIYARVAF